MENKDELRIEKLKGGYLLVFNSYEDYGSNRREIITTKHNLLTAIGDCLDLSVTHVEEDGC